MGEQLWINQSVFVLHNRVGGVQQLLILVVALNQPATTVRVRVYVPGTGRYAKACMLGDIYRGSATADEPIVHVNFEKKRAE